MSSEALSAAVEAASSTGKRGMPIFDYDRRHARRKWLGLTSAGKPTVACDAEFFHRFGQEQVDQDLLARFGAVNTVRRPSGGYSICRRFTGGTATWAPRIAAFLAGDAAKARVALDRAPFRRREIVCSLIQELALLNAPARNGDARGLGISAASKILFFACPEMPFFIYDSVVRRQLGMPALSDGESYGAYWDRCWQAFAAEPHSTPGPLPENSSWPGSPPEQWFTRRCLDLSFYPTPGRVSERAEVPPA
jgi:hypothetical protein